MAFLFRVFINAEVDCVLYLQSGYDKHERLEEDRGALINYIISMNLQKNPASYLYQMKLQFDSWHFAISQQIHVSSSNCYFFPLEFYSSGCSFYFLTVST